MRIFIFVIAALLGYLVSGFNPAITLSRILYKKDIRQCGSGNPGFTNFKRCFGGVAWIVLLLDMLKAAVVVAPMGFAFREYWGDFALGAAFTGLFCVLGHAYPLQYRFKGGKGFLVSLSTLWAVDLRVGCICTAVMVILLLVSHYMSLSTVSALLLAPIIMIIFDLPLPSVLLVAAFVIFTAIRHRENFSRLLSGTERKFYLFKKRTDA